MGAAQADMAGKNILVGALVGGLIGAVSAGVGGWVGGTVTQYLTTTVWIAESATATAAANIVGAMAGGFAGGAVSGGLNASVYGGNVWQSALYGGLAGAAIAGLIQGAIELNKWVNGQGLTAQTSGFKQYAQIDTDTQPITSEYEIRLLARVTYAEAAGEYRVPNAMEGVAWVVRNRVESIRFPGTYEEVIYSGEFTSVGGRLWNEASNPSALSGVRAAAYERALNVATGVYHGAIPDPTGGAVFFHSGPPGSWFTAALAQGGTIVRIEPRIGPFTFYRLR